MFSHACSLRSGQLRERCTANPQTGACIGARVQLDVQQWLKSVCEDATSGIWSSQKQIRYSLGVERRGSGISSNHDTFDLFLLGEISHGFRVPMCRGCPSVPWTHGRGLARPCAVHMENVPWVQGTDMQPCPALTAYRSPGLMGDEALQCPQCGHWRVPPRKFPTASRQPDSAVTGTGCISVGAW